MSRGVISQVNTYSIATLVKSTLRDKASHHGQGQVTPYRSPQQARLYLLITYLNGISHNSLSFKKDITKKNPPALKSKKQVKSLKLTFDNRRDAIHFHCHILPPTFFLLFSAVRFFNFFNYNFFTQFMPKFPNANKLWNMTNKPDKAD